MREKTDPIDPRIDIVFKRIFGTEGHTGIAKSFLNAIFKVAGFPAVRELAIQNPFRYAEFRGEKDIELDILYTDENGRQVQLEMQVAYHDGLEQRMLHNWAQLYLRQIDKGRSYRDHNPVVSLWVLERPLWNDGEWLHVIRLRCERTGQLFHEDQCFIAVELDAWRRLMLARSGDTIVNEGKEQEWLYFLAQGHRLSPESLGVFLSDPVFKEALELMADFNASKRRRHYYDMRRNYTHLIASYKETGYEEGRKAGLAAGLAEGHAEGHAEGRAEGIEEGIKLGESQTKQSAILALAREGVPSTLIVKALGLSTGEVEKILDGSAP